MVKKYSTNGSKKQINIKLIIIIVAVLLIGGGVSFFIYSSNKSINNQMPQSDIVDESINLNPTSEEIKKETEQQKKELSENTKESDNSTVIPTSEVKPVIIDSSQYGPIVEVRAFTPGIFESNGKCKIEFKKDGSTVTKETSTYQDASSTNCNNLEVSINEFSDSGEWQVSVTYTGSFTSKTEVKNMVIEK